MARPDANRPGKAVKVANEAEIPEFDLFALGDFALKEFTKAQAEDLYELIDGYHRTRLMIVTDNRSPKGLVSTISQPCNS